MIYFISDIHENVNFKGLKQYIDIAKDDDLLIILGDVSLNFTDTEESKSFTKWFLSIDKNIAFIDGNHENFAYINSFPIENWNGGKVNRLTKNIVHMIRGNVYEIFGYKFFAFGGCKSSAKWKEQGLWHFGEEPTDAECKLAIDNLNNHGNTVDFIITHKYEIIGLGNTRCQKLLDLCSYIDRNVNFKKWLFGHWHRAYIHDQKHLCVYDELTPITDIE